MTREDDFLHALHESPENVELRLVFSDWLEDRVDPRGALMRAQVLLSILPHDDPARSELEAQQQFLLAEEEPEWLRPLHGLFNGWSAPGTAVTVYASNWVEEANWAIATLAV